MIETFVKLLWLRTSLQTSFRTDISTFTIHLKPVRLYINGFTGAQTPRNQLLTHPAK